MSVTPGANRKRPKVCEAMGFGIPALLSTACMGLASQALRSRVPEWAAIHSQYFAKTAAVIWLRARL